MYTSQISDDISSVGGNVLRIAQGVSAAGVILSVVGIAIDVVFLGHAVYDLLKKDMEDFSQALLNISDLMEEINYIHNSNP